MWSHPCVPQAFSPSPHQRASLPQHLQISCPISVSTYNYAFNSDSLRSPVKAVLGCYAGRLPASISAVSHLSSFDSPINGSGQSIGKQSSFFASCPTALWYAFSAVAHEPAHASFPSTFTLYVYLLKSLLRVIVISRSLSFNACLLLAT